MRKTIILTLALVLAASVLYAADVKKERGFWDNLLKKVMHIIPRKRATDMTTTAVAGIRGAKDESAGNLYWKGKKEELVVSTEELEKFNKSLTLAMGGKSEESLKSFEEFLATYPESQLREDALDAIKNLRAENKTQPPKPDRPKP
jgi:TolA-binding protein